MATHAPNPAVFEEIPRQFGAQPSMAQMAPHSAVVFGEAGGAVCTGSLVALDLVITLARCLYLGGVRVENETTVQVFAGVNSLSNLKRKSVQEGVVDRLIVHPGFRYSPNATFFGYNDLLIIHLKEALMETDSVKPIEMSEMSWSGGEDEVKSCHLAGYSSVNPISVNWDVDNSLKMNNVHATKDCPCGDTLLYHFGHNRVKRWICAKPDKGYTPCVGAAGAGLVCDGRLSGILAGLIPFDNIYQCQFNHKPLVSCKNNGGLAVFIDLCAYQRWMHFHFGHLPPGPINCDSAATSPKSTITVVVIVTHVMKMLNDVVLHVFGS